MRGVPLSSSRANACGNRPSRAAASGSCADSSTQPLSAPKQEIAATIAMPVAACGPHSAPAASAIGAVESFAMSGGITPSTAVQARMVAMPASRVPISVARGIVRSASRIAPAGMVAASRPRKAHSVSATVACTAAAKPRVSPLSAAEAGTVRCAGSISQIATPPNSSSGSSFSTVVTTCMRPASRTPARLIAAHSHRAASASAAPRSGVATSAGNRLPRLPANATAIAAFAHQIEIQ